MIKALFTSSMIALLFSACASMAPPEDRQVIYVEATTAPKGTAFNRAQAHFAKSLGDSNHAIKMKDEASGQIVLHGNVDCNVLRQSGDSNGYNLAFNLDFQAKDNRARLAFEDLQMLTPQGKPVQFSYNQITDKGKAEAVKPCLEPLRASIIKAINGANAGSW